MTNYITSAGVQNFSITIAALSTTGTATINAVGSGAYISAGGINPSVAANSEEIFAYLSLTNSTTITATRTLGTTGTVVVTGSIVDGDLTNLVKSVQYGTISVPTSSTSASAAISAVTVADTAVHYLGVASGDTTLAFKTDLYYINLSSTTSVTAHNGVSGGVVASTVGFVAVQFQSSCLTANAVQNIALSIATGFTSTTVGITSVTPGNAVCFYGGCNSENFATNANPALMNGALTSATVFTIQCASSNAFQQNYNASVVEFNSGVLNSSIQRGLVTLTAASSNTASLSPSINTSYSGVNWLGNTTTAGLSVTNEALGEAALTATNTVTVTKNSATANITGSFEAFEFPAFSGGGSFNPAWAYRSNQAFSGSPY